eukprot:jgi/Botrbrau1/4157/Bobra.0192s0025.1
MNRFMAAEKAPLSESGACLLANLREKSRLLPIGVQSVDELLHGGMREGQHLELVGQAGAGKTQLCLLAAMTTAVRGEGVVYIDTCASFSARRMALLFRHSPAAQQGKVALAAFVEALSRVTVYRAHDIHTLLGILNKLSLQFLEAESGTASGKSPSKPRVSLVVVDSPAALIGPLLGGAGAGHQGHALMIALGRQLRSLARRFTLAVLSTNHLVGGGRGAGLRPALGGSWQNQAHVRLQLGVEAEALDPAKKHAEAGAAQGADDGMRVAVLRASSIGPCGEMARFALMESGAIRSC